MKRLFTVAAISAALMTAGCSSDSTPATQTPVTPTTPAVQTPVNGGLVASAGFASATGWSSGSDGEDVSGNIAVDNGNNVYSITVPAGTATPDAPWNRNLQQKLTLNQGKSYTVKFKAKSDRNRSIFVGIGQNAEPYANDKKSVDLTSEWQNFEETLSAAAFGGEDSRVFFEFAGAEGLVMLDDVIVTEVATTTPEPSTKSQIDLPVNFEGSEVDYAVTDFGGNSSTLVADPTNATNMVVKTLKLGDAQTWAGTTIGNSANTDDKKGFATAIPFTSTATTMSVDVYSPAAGITVRFKVEKSTDNTVTAETETLTTKANEWETLVFDLNNVAAGTSAFDSSKGYDKASIFFNFDVSGEAAGEQTYYWDNVKFGGESTTPAPTLSQISLPVNFDSDSVDYTVTDFGGNASTLQPDPADASNKVMSTVKGGETWAGTTISKPEGLAAAIPFSDTATEMTVRVYSPASGTPVLLKVEDASDAGIFVETLATTSMSDAWETLTFNFSNPGPNDMALNVNNTYNKASIFFNFGNAGTGETYLWDDVKFVGSTEPPALSQVALPINFDSTTVDYTVSDFGGNASTLTNDPVDSSNKVMRSIKGGETWAGTTASKPEGLASAIPFTDTAKEMTVRVYSPASGTPVLLKVENKDNAGVFVETLATTTTSNAWETLTFDFNNPGPNDMALNLDNTYDKVSIFFNFGNAGSGETYYWDDLQHVAPAAPTLSQIALPINFDGSSVDYTVTDFGGNTSTLSTDPSDSTNKVMSTVKGSETWAGTTASKPEGLATAIPFTATATKMTARVYSPASGTPVLLKVEDASNAGIFVETLATTATSEAWETLTFDFSNPGPNDQALNVDNTYNKVSIFFNFGNAGTGETYLWDDLQFVSP